MNFNKFLKIFVISSKARNKVLPSVARQVLIFLIIFAWIFSGWPQIWPLGELGVNKIQIPPEIQEAKAINKVNNPHFPSDAVGWATTNGSGTNICGDNGELTETSFVTFGFTSADGNPAGSFEGDGGGSNNQLYRGKITQTITTPAESVKIKGRFDYYVNTTSWQTDNAWIRLDIYDSADSTFIANLGCVQFSANSAWNTTAFSSDVVLSASTTYTIRVTLRMKRRLAAIAIRVDNIIVNFAPTGLSASAPADTTNAQLDWTASTPGTGAAGLHATTPYKVYRDASSPVSTFLTSTTTNSYTDTSTIGNTTYYYAVSDVDTASIESPLSAEVSILTRPGVPGTPTFTNIATSTLTVNWTAPTGGAGALTYKIYQCEGSGCTPSETPIASGVADLFYNDSGLTPNTLYRYRIRATNATPADGAYSGIGEVTTQAGYTVSCSASTSTTDFGTLTTSVITTSTPDIVITMSCDYPSGCTLRVQDDGNTTNPGLNSSTATYLIGSANAAWDDTDTLVQGTEGYGIQATTNANGSGGTLTLAARYNQTGDNIGGLEITDVDISSSTVPITNRETVIKHKAAIGNLTAAASDYTDIITYGCIGN